MSIWKDRGIGRSSGSTLVGVKPTSVSSKRRRRGKGKNSFDPVSEFFSAGEYGAIIDPLLSTKYTDQAGTILVTASGDLCRHVVDITPNAQSFTGTQSSTYQEGDGLYWIQAPNGPIALSNPSGISTRLFTKALGGCMAIAIEATQSEQLDGIIEEYRQDVPTRGVLIYSDTRAAGTGGAVSTTDGTATSITNSLAPRPTGKRTFILNYDGTNDTFTLYENGTAVGTAVKDIGTGIQGGTNMRLNIFRRTATNEYFQEGKIYYAMFRDRTLTPAQIASLDTLLKTRAGI